MDVVKRRSAPDETLSLDTVRALHQTVRLLRSALDRSNEELKELKACLRDQEATNVTIEQLALENHVLRRQRLADNAQGVDARAVMEPPGVEEEKKEEEKEEETQQEDGENDEDGSSDESEELDDIELIFTTEDTKELSVLREDLVSFSDTEGWQTGAPQIKFQDADSFDEAAEIEIETQEKIQYDLKTWTHTVFVETDISKCGVADENEAPEHSPRRNTLPDTLAYQPIVHREAMRQGPCAAKFPARGVRNGAVNSPVRPILVERNSAKRESEAQTDITALPSHWRSESYLAHKVSHAFTTLPSKFSLPVRAGEIAAPRGSLRLSDKTQEARRTLLSDINFTSMVPELSRSADHLCREGVCCKSYPRVTSYMKSAADSLASPGYFHSRDYGKDVWSPCECPLPFGRVRSSWDNRQAVPRYRGTLASAPSYEETRRRHSSTSWRDPACPRPTYGSVPSSPTRARSAARHEAPRSRPRNKVTFHGANVTRSVAESSFRRVGRPGRSLPDLRIDLGAESGDSTDSLIDEAEDYLRRSIDSILTGTDYNRMGESRRRFSNPDPVREFLPPKCAQPFLPKVPRDLKLDHLVKVIGRDNRVMVGRVRYVGTVQTGGEPFVGVQLPTDSGNADGSCHGRRYFDCDPDHAVFVPFKKVIMAWSF